MKALDDIARTRPYFSLTVAKLIGDADAVSTARTLIEELKLELAIKRRSTDRRLLKQGEEIDDELASFFLHYVEDRSPAWLVPTENEEILDQVNHLLVICGYRNYVALYASDSAAQRVLGRRLNTDESTGGFAHLARVPHRHLAQAFVSGAVRTLWLSGIHRRTAVKADSKILSGVRLQDALKPLDDQSYHYTAARALARVGQEDKPVGISQRRSKVWIGATSGWTDFKDKTASVVEALLRAEASAPPSEPHLPFLAYPANDTEGLKGAFDVALVPPELLALDAYPDASQIELAEKWAYRSEFRISSATSGEIQTEVFLDGVRLATVRFHLQVHSPEDVDCSIECDEDPAADEVLVRELLQVVNNRSWLQIRFESGHVLSEGAIYQLRFRDQPFQNWRFEDLGELGENPETDPKKEKPTPPDNPHQFLVDEIGQHQSLFCWVQRHWFGLEGLGSTRGWLACDDGSMEIADFVHLDLEPADDKPPRISLIHVKGSKSGSSEREISVSDYEVVCGQAVKNLRSLDQRNLAADLEAGANKAVAAATWKGGEKQDDRSGMIAALTGLGSNYRRRVVVFQPRVTEKAYRAAQSAIDSGDDGPEARRLRQLNTLLLATEADCQELGADFLVLSAKVPD